jgi:thymidylate synthase/SAM-dependent methyltransferase
MTTNFKDDTLEKVWVKALRAITTSGQPINDEEPFLEIQNLQLAFKNAFETDAPHYKKVFGTTYLEYMQRVYSPAGDPKSGRNYYKLIHEQGGVDQAERVIEKLKAEPLTRSATIVLATPETKKQPCVTEVNFSIRHDLLQMTLIFKSSDVAKKFIPDIIELSRVHEYISRSIGVARGTVTAHILSAQIYETDVALVSNAIHSITLSNYFQTERTIENWDKEAPEWDKNIQRPEHYVNIENGYARFLEFMEVQIPRAQSGSHPIALDSGCGTGIIAEILKEKGYGVSGIDISPQMLRFAHKNPEAIHYVLANSLDLPFPDAAFDLVCTRGVLISHIGRKYVSLFIQEHRRVLKKDGLFVFDFITHFDKSETRYRRKKAALSYETVVKTLREHGFEVLARSGTDANRVNAVACRKIG